MRRNVQQKTSSLEDGNSAAGANCSSGRNSMKREELDQADLRHFLTVRAQWDPICCPSGLGKSEQEDWLNGKTQRGNWSLGSLLGSALERAVSASVSEEQEFSDPAGSVRVLKEHVFRSWTPVCW